MKLFSILIITMFVFISCSQNTRYSDNQKNIKTAQDKSKLIIDLSKMPYITGKGRIQDKEYNPNVPLIDEIIAYGKESIPVLIDMLDDETEVPHQVFSFWPRNTIGDIALAILTDLTTDSTWIKSTIPGTSYEDILGVEKDPDVPFWNYLYDYIEKHGRKEIKEKWHNIWLKYKDKIYWDSKERCFKIERN